MESDLFIIASFNGRNELTPVKDAPSFDCLTMFIKDKLGINSKDLFYEFTPGQQCSLLTEADFSNMVLLAGMRSIKVISVGCKGVQRGEPCSNPRRETINRFFSSSKNKTGSTLSRRKYIEVGGRSRSGVVRNQGIPPNSPEHKVPNNISNEQLDLNQSPVEEHNSINPDDQAEFASEVLSTRYSQEFDINKFKISSMPKSAKKKHQEKLDGGDFFPGSKENYPLFDIAPEEDDIVLRSANWVDYISGTGQVFRGGVVDFRHKLVKYAAKLGFRFVYARNDARYVKARCKLRDEDQCLWSIDGSVSSVTDEFIIKKSNLIHTCTLSMVGNDVKRLGCRILGNLITDAVRSDPSKTATNLKAEFQRFYGFDIPYEKVWRGVEIARSNLFGSYDDSFDELRWYSQAILKTNPGSLVFLETEPMDNRFKRFFVSFNASREGFKKCRPMLFVDGTFMKTRYKGTLLSATTKDGNNGLFPVAIALVDSENNDNWSWFIKKIKDNIQYSSEIMYVSDRAGGLMHAFDAVYERPLHFFCLFHLMKNLRGMYKGKTYSDIFKNTMCKYLSDMAYAPNMQYFEVAKLRFLTKGGLTAQAFLQELPYDKWAVAFATEVHRYGELTSNAAESFNNWILPARGLPVTFMIDCIRTQLMKWFSERREAGRKWTGALTEEMEEAWNTSKSIGDSWTIIPTNNNAVFEVLSAKSCVVNLHAKTCTCYNWQVKGFPCVHAISVLKRANWNIRDVIDPCFFSDTYQMIYEFDIYPIANTEKHEVIDLNVPEKINPPIQRRNPDRPRKKRFKSRGEGKGKQFICGRRGEYGYHYWTTCRDALN